MIILVVLFTPLISAEPSSSLRETSSSYQPQCNKITVESCEDVSEGVKLRNFAGTEYVLAHGCRDAGHGLRNYRLHCLSSRSYEVCWVPCAQETGERVDPRQAVEVPIPKEAIPVRKEVLSEVIKEIPSRTAMVRCSDSDNGANLFVQGRVTGTSRVTHTLMTLADSCSSDYQVVEFYCDNGYAAVKDPDRGSDVFSLLSSGTYCPEGTFCRDGACQRTQLEQKPSVAPADTDVSCTDTDRGDKPFVKGVTSGINDAMLGGRIRVEDSCEGNTLHEYICSPAKNARYSPVVGLRQYTCQSGCRDGVCLSGEAQDIYAEKTRPVIAPVNTGGSKPRCYDSDGGDEIYTQGRLEVETPQWGKQIVYEYCSNEQRENLEEGAYVEELVCLTNDPQYAYEHIPTKCPANTYCRQGACVRDDGIQKEMLPAYDEYRDQPDSDFVCKDTDSSVPYEAGRDIYTQGTIRGLDYYKQKIVLSKDYCTEIYGGAQTNSGAWVAEETCDAEQRAHTYYYECPRGSYCRNGACQYQQLTEEISYDEEQPQQPVDSCLNGCLLNNRCLPYGYRTLIRGQPVFCSITNDLQSQLTDGLSCENNHECITNSCYKGICVDIQQQLEETQGALFKLLKRLEFLFK